MPEGVVASRRNGPATSTRQPDWRIREPIHYGDWTGDRTDTLINQDVVVAHKR